MSSFFAAYAAGNADAFLPAHPLDRSARLRAVERATRPVNPQLACELRAQNARYASSPARDAHLSALESGAAAVVTGQQVGVFLGPLFTIYKAASAIAIARQLSQETGLPVVPVFWLQTEDHDLAEIAHYVIPRSGEQAPLELSLAVDGSARVSIAHCALPREVTDWLSIVRGELAQLPHAEEHLARLERAYVPGARWSDAFAEVLAALFAPEGLVLLDPRTEALAPLATPVHRAAIERAPAISAVLLARQAQLSTAGFAPQVHVRAASPLCFFHPSGPERERCRLDPCGEHFAQVTAQSLGKAPVEHTRDELLDRLQRQPLCFSTSALLRPLLQDTWLPTAVYVAGPGEIAYFAQLPPVYEELGVTMPLIAWRARCTIIEPKIARVLERTGLRVSDLAQSESALLSMLSARRASFTPDALELALRERFDTAIDEVLASTGSARATLYSAQERTRAFVHTAAGKLAEKYRQALAQQDGALTADVRRLRHALRPLGEPQERVFGFASFAARYGERALLESLLQRLAADPFTAAEHELRV